MRDTRSFVLCPPFREGGRGGQRWPHIYWQAALCLGQEIKLSSPLQHEEGLGGCDKSCQCWYPVPATADKARQLRTPGKHRSGRVGSRACRGEEGRWGHSNLCRHLPRAGHGLLPVEGLCPALSPHTWTWHTVSLPHPCLAPAGGRALSFSGELVLVGMRTGTSFTVKLVTATMLALVQHLSSLSSSLGFSLGRCQPACQMLEASWELCELMGGVLVDG